MCDQNSKYAHKYFLKSFFSELDRCWKNFNSGTEEQMCFCNSQELPTEVSRSHGQLNVPLEQNSPVRSAVSCFFWFWVSVWASLLGLGGRAGVICPATILFSWFEVPVLALGATAGLGGGFGLAKDGVSLTEGVTLGGGGLGAGTGMEVPGVRVSVAGLGVSGGFSVFLESGGTGAELEFGAKDGVGSVSGWEVSVDSEDLELHDSSATAVEPSSSQNNLVDGLGACEKFLGFGATVGGTDLAGCPWRRGRGRGSGLFVAPKSLLLLSPQLPSATGCCSKACILAFSVPMSSWLSSSSPSSLSDWPSLLSLRRSGKPQSSEPKASRSSWRYFP